LVPPTSGAELATSVEASPIDVIKVLMANGVCHIPTDRFCLPPS
jgi:hypothetical protein